jgi:hypothetical protein
MFGSMHNLAFHVESVAMFRPWFLPCQDFSIQSAGHHHYFHLFDATLLHSVSFHEEARERPCACH